MKRLLDLRFVIGLFFIITGLLLIIYYLTSSASSKSLVNLWSGIIFLLFGLMMGLLSFLQKKEEEV